MILEGFISLGEYKISSKNRVIIIIYNINEIKKRLLNKYQRYLWWLLATAAVPPVVSPSLAFGSLDRHGSGADRAVSIRESRLLLRLFSGEELGAVEFRR